MHTLVYIIPRSSQIPRRYPCVPIHGYKLQMSVLVQLSFSQLMPHFIVMSTQVVAKDNRARSWVLSAQEYIPLGRLLGQTASLSVN